MASSFHVSLELKGQKEVAAGAGGGGGGGGESVVEREPVHYKHDGERFPEGQQNTVKLNVGCTYVFTVHFRPARVLTHWMIRGEKVDFERVNPSKAEEDVSIYEATWSSTGISVTKRAERYPLAMELEVYPGLVMKMVLQTKFYPQTETTHRKWGPEVHSVEYKCQIPEGQMSIDILNEKII
ncbi:CB1 cannabinoid receptor-interacting protein 1-like [Babylonia areolata]|uniref:CB1 cannabinoid receptor-interacting protein 1-like n=1 Tax=Babylonia areolata TaxID=304850 RepID=UPI003FD1BC50